MKWTIEKIKKEALKYNNRTEFKNNCTGYQSALRKGIIKEVCAHMAEVRHHWTDEELSEEALKYNSRIEFESKSPKAYNSALKRKLINIICFHMRPSLTDPYTLEEIKQEALKYNSRAEFAKNSGGAYNAAIKRNDFEEIVSHMDLILKYRSLEDLKKEALKYKTRGEFYKKNKNAYQVAVKRSDYEQIVSHMDITRVNWTFEKLHNEALKYKTLIEFQKKNKGAYLAAYRRNILDEISSHMVAISGPSFPEIELFNTIKSIWPKTQKFKELRIKIKNRPYVNSFEIDIYIPELRKGIEFDGKYWHSLKGLKRSHPSWPINGLKLYHQIKDNYFLSKGIRILHIKEEDWEKNKEECLKKCLEFLKT